MPVVKNGKEDRGYKENPVSKTTPGIPAITRNVSPKHDLPPANSLVSQINHSVNNSVSQSNSYNKGIANGAQIAKAARSRLKGMQNSHSNKKLPTWKGNSLLTE